MWLLHKDCRVASGKGRAWVTDEGMSGLGLLLVLRNALQ